MLDLERELPGGDAEAESPRTLGIRHYLGVLRRRAKIMLACIVVLPVVTYLIAHASKPSYQATSSVLLSDQDLASSLLGVGSTNISAADPTLIPDTEAEVAQASPVLMRAAAAVPRAGLTAHELGQQSSVTPGSDTNTLTFTVSDQSRSDAVALANAYANAYVTYSRQLDTAAIATAISDVQSKLSKSAPGSALTASLQDRLDELQTYDALETANAQLLESARMATKVSPRPKTDTVLALLVAIILAVGLALLLESLDSRIHELDELDEIVGAPRLGMLPPPNRRARSAGTAVGAIASTQAEAFMLLRAALSFALTSQRHQVLLITSALAQEGKSTTAANLATALARSGKSVCLVDLDLRHPSVARLFGVVDAPGVTEVLLGAVELDEAVRLIETHEPEHSPASNGRSRGAATGPVAIMTAGIVPPYPVDAGTIQGIDKMISSLRRGYDVVILDTPPTVQVSDALTLAAHADAVLLVTRLNMVSRQALREAVRLLRAAPPLLLGYAVTGTSPGPVGYGYRYGYDAPASEDAQQVRLRLPAPPRERSKTTSW